MSIDMIESKPVIRYFNINQSNQSEFHDSIDAMLNILGGVVIFERKTRDVQAYSYDFKNIGTNDPQTGTATVFIHNCKTCYNNNHPVSVHLNGFCNNSFYKKLLDSLVELREFYRKQ